VTVFKFLINFQEKTQYFSLTVLHGSDFTLWFAFSQNMITKVSCMNISSTRVQFWLL